MLWQHHSVLNRLRKAYQIGFIEEVADALLDILEEPVGVAQDVKPQDEDIGLLDALGDVMALDLGQELTGSQEDVPLLKVRQSGRGD